MCQKKGRTTASMRAGSSASDRESKGLVLQRRDAMRGTPIALERARAGDSFRTREAHP